MNRSAPGLSISKCIDGFLKFKTAEGLSQRTTSSYEYTLNHWLKHIGDEDVAEIQTSDLPDGLGSLRYLTNQSSEITLTQSYDPYGNVMSSSGTSISTYGFTGEQTDPSGMQYLRARHYNSSLSMFTSHDSSMGGLTQSIGQNTYSYAYTNPATMTDPSGKNPFLIDAAVGGLIGGGIELGTQLYNQRDFTLSQALRCLQRGKVGLLLRPGL